MARKGSVFLTASVLALALCAAGAVPARQGRSEGRGLRKCHAQQPATSRKAAASTGPTSAARTATRAPPESKTNIPLRTCHEGGEALQAAQLPRLPQEPPHPTVISFDKKADAPCLTCPRSRSRSSRLREQARAAGLLLLAR